MKNTLQYIYSISVLVGVLVTSYLMMNRETNADIASRSLATPALKMHAESSDPALRQILEMESVFTQLKNRVPSEEIPVRKLYIPKNSEE